MNRSGTLYLFLPVGGLALTTWIKARSGGWSSPFSVYIPLAVTFAALITDWRRASVIATVGALVMLSPMLYSHAADPVVVALVKVPAYGLLVVMICTMTGWMRRRQQEVEMADVAREQLELRARGLVTLQGISAIVGAHLSLDDAIKAIVHVLGNAFGHQLISVYLRNGDELIMQAQVGYTDPYTIIHLGEGICGRTGATGTTSFVPDVALDPSYRPAVDGVVSELCVPLLDRDHVAGVLNVESTQTLTELDRELLELFGSQVSVVLRDPLTDLLNHRALMEEIDGMIVAGSGRCAALMIDLNNFKHFNDAFGHLTGDAILRQMAMILRDNCRKEDVAGRFGGDEFVVVLPGAERSLAESVAVRISTQTSKHNFVTPGSGRIALGASIGVAVFPDDGATRQELLSKADASMYASKRSASSCA